MRYLYSGPPQSISLAVEFELGGKGKAKSIFADFDLFLGQECDLPAENPIVQSMLASKLLLPVTGGSQPTSTSEDKGEK